MNKKNVVLGVSMVVIIAIVWTAIYFVALRATPNNSEQSMGIATIGILGIFVYFGGALFLRWPAPKASVKRADEIRKYKQCG